MTTLIEDTAPDTGAADLGLRERKKQQTRNAIHEAAFDLIESQGLEATTIDQICSAADVSTRTFFNYFPTKAAAAFEISSTRIDDAAREKFLAAKGTLVEALCDAIGESAELGPSHDRLKKLMIQRPELITTLSQMMLEVRGQYIALASERASSPEVAELAVTLVMASLGRTMHDDNSANLPLATRMRTIVAKLIAVGGEQLQPA